MKTAIGFLDMRRHLEHEGGRAASRSEQQDGDCDWSDDDNCDRNDNDNNERSGFNERSYRQRLLSGPPSADRRHLTDGSGASAALDRAATDRGS